MVQKKTLVLGASDNPSRYSYLAIKRLEQYGHPVIAIGRKHTAVGETIIHTEKIPTEGIDTITLYLNAQNQKPYYDYILSIKPHRIIFNPGAENEELKKLAAEKNIQTIEACTLVMLSTGQY